MIHDGTHTVNFTVHQIRLHKDSDTEEQRQLIEDQVISGLTEYRRLNACKLLGAGVTVELDSAAPRLCSRLWSELDLVPIVFNTAVFIDQDTPTENVEELVDSAARKCFG